ncbi:MAG: PcfK-like family protein [Dysgonomonas sp.]|uniref:PcfK-like family protein n=1 Tax=Dysgonomonas sp. TaxID=1891233 RepID=UPI0039E3467F
MKSTDHFKDTIKAYLDKRSNEDTQFALAYAKESKNIDDCITYILNSVQQSGCNGFADDEIFGMAVHYYDEDNIDIGKPISSKVIVNHPVEITQDEKDEAKKQAIESYKNEVLSEMRAKTIKPKKKAEPENIEQSLFDL